MTEEEVSWERSQSQRHCLELSLPRLHRAISCGWLRVDESPAPTAASLRGEMQKGAEADPPGQLLNSSIDLKGSGDPGHPANSSSRKPAVWDRPAGLRAIIVVTTVVIIALLVALIVGSLLPYEGKLDHWIGLRKDTGQVWKWANGTEFDRRFQIQGGADCAYLDKDLTVSSSSCRTLRKWICSKPDTPVKREE